MPGFTPKWQQQAGEVLQPAGSAVGLCLKPACPAPYLRSELLSWQDELDSAPTMQRWGRITRFVAMQLASVGSLSPKAC